MTHYFVDVQVTKVFIAWDVLVFIQDATGQPLYRSILVENIEPLLVKMVSDGMGDWYSATKKKELSDWKRVTSHDIRAYLLADNKHPAKLHPDLFSSEFPQAVLSYQWDLGMDKVLNVLNDPKALNDADILKDSRVRRGKNGLPNPRVWVDILFIDQLAKNIPVELGVAQEYYILCILHIVAGSPTFLERGWCLWELGLRAHAKKRSVVIGELENKVLFWENPPKMNIAECI